MGKYPEGNSRCYLRRLWFHPCRTSCIFDFPSYPPISNCPPDTVGRIRYGTLQQPMRLWLTEEPPSYSFAFSLASTWNPPRSLRTCILPCKSDPVKGGRMQPPRLVQRLGTSEHQLLPPFRDAKLLPGPLPKKAISERRPLPAGESISVTSCQFCSFMFSHAEPRGPATPRFQQHMTQRYGACSTCRHACGLSSLGSSFGPACKCLCQRI